MKEVWMAKLFLPISSEGRSRWRHYLPDSILVIVALLLQPVIVLMAGGFLAPSKSWWELLLLSWMIPFLSWNWFMGNVVYLHHTHPQIAWFAKEPPLAFAERQMLIATHVVFPAPIDWLLYSIMAQNAHHLKPAIPFYNLGQAQEKLENKYPSQVLTYQWTPSEHLRITHLCKLYDFNRHCWTDFNGLPTAFTSLAPSSSNQALLVER
jgi:omega-6 fatty acid desaturase (delta-12 desaturase)